MTYKEASEWLIQAAANYRDGYKIREDEKFKIAEAIHAITTGNFSDQKPAGQTKKEETDAKEADTNA